MPRKLNDSAVLERLVKMRVLVSRTLLSCFNSAGFCHIRFVAEIESFQPVAPRNLAVRNLVKPLLHVGREIIVDINREIRFQKPYNRKRKPRRDQSPAALINVSAIDNRRNNARIRRRTSDFARFKRFNKRSLGITRRRNSFMPDRVNVPGSKFFTLGHLRQSTIVVAGIFARAVSVCPQPAREVNNSAGSLKYRSSVRTRFSLKSNGCRRTGRIGHLRCQSAPPDKRINSQLVGRDNSRQILGRFKLRSRGTNSFMSLLRSCGFGDILFRSFRQVLRSPAFGNALSCRIDSLAGQCHRIGTHISDISVFIQSLSRAHSCSRTHSQTIAGSLLQSRSRKRRNRTSAIRTLLQARNRKSRIGIRQVRQTCRIA